MKTSELNLSGDREKPIDLKIKREELIDELRRRLHKLFSVYDCDPTPDGWRKLALCLIAKYELKQPKVKAGTYQQQFAVARMADLIQHKQQYPKIIQAARRVAKEVYKLKSKDAIAKRAEILRKQYRRAKREGNLIIPADVVKFWTALRDAARQIEDNN